MEKTISQQDDKISQLDTFLQESDKEFNALYSRINQLRSNLNNPNLNPNSNPIQKELEKKSNTNDKKN